MTYLVQCKKRRFSALDKNKLRQYDLTASIHTVEIHSNCKPRLTGLCKNSMKVHYIFNDDTGRLTSHCIVNPHSFVDVEILEYSRYKAVVAKLAKMARLRNYKYDRIDIRLDSYDDNFLEFFKLNSLLIGLFSSAYKFKQGEPNATYGLLARRNHNVYVKNHYMEIEYYDKQKATGNRFDCKARLEFRAKKLNGKNPISVAELWRNRFEKLDVQYFNFLDSCNKSLYRHYERWLLQNQSPKTKSDMLLPFIRENQEIVFSTKQLELFCQMCGVKNPKSRAKNICNSCGIETVSLPNIREYIAKIENAITQYMES